MNIDVCVCTCACVSHVIWPETVSQRLIAESSSQRGGTLLPSTTSWFISQDKWLKQVTLDVLQRRNYKLKPQWLSTSKTARGAGTRQFGSFSFWVHSDPLQCQPPFIFVCWRTSKSFDLLWVFLLSSVQHVNSTSLKIFLLIHPYL